MRLIFGKRKINLPKSGEIIATEIFGAYSWPRAVPTVLVSYYNLQKPTSSAKYETDTPLLQLTLKPGEACGVVFPALKNCGGLKQIGLHPDANFFAFSRSMD